jgi:hypothetical protein
MRRLLAFVVATALVTVAAASVAAAAKSNFSGERAIDSVGRLHVAFTELGAGNKVLSYRLQATGEVTYTCGGVFFGTGTFGGSSWNDPWQRATIQGERGRVSGTLWHETLLTRPSCPPNELGEIPPIAVSAISWTEITVTSSSGKVLSLDEISRAL